MTVDGRRQLRNDWLLLGNGNPGGIFQTRVYRFDGFQTRVPGFMIDVKTLRTQDTSDPRHFGTSAEVSHAEVPMRHFGTSAELSGHFGTKAQMSWDTSALRKTLWYCATLDGKVDECLHNTVN